MFHVAEIFELFALLLKVWRVVLGAAAALAVSFVVRHTFEGFPQEGWKVLALAGASMGAVWELGVAVRRDLQRHASYGLSKTFKFLALAIIGCAWGWLIEGSFGLGATVGVLTLGPIVLVPCFGLIAGLPMTLRDLAWVEAAVLSGFFVTFAMVLVLGG